MTATPDGSHTSMTADPAMRTKAARTRQRVLASAARELSLHGYEATSLRNIAAGAGLQLGSLYFHFASKADLLEEVLRDAVDAASERIDRALDALGGASAGARLAAAIETHLLVLHEVRDRGAAVVRVIDPGSAGPDQRARSHAHRYVARWCELVGEAQRAGAIDPALDTYVVTRLLLGAMNATLGRQQIDAVAVRQLADTVRALFIPE